MSILSLRLAKPAARGFLALALPLTAGAIASLHTPVPYAQQSAANPAKRELVFELDASRTKVSYTLDATAHTVHGEFRLKSGTVRFDPATGDAAGEIVIDAASGNSGNDSRDEKMRREVLESARYPEIAFRPDHVQGDVALPGKSQVNIHGIFQIHGVGHEITVPADVDCAADGCQVFAKWVVPYVDWGMKNPSTFFLRVGKTVEIEFQTKIRFDSPAAGR
jgi:polyisoprenoid-binding protein YceI